MNFGVHWRQFTLKTVDGVTSTDDSPAPSALDSSEGLRCRPLSSILWLGGLLNDAFNTENMEKILHAIIKEKLEGCEKRLLTSK